MTMTTQTKTATADKVSSAANITATSAKLFIDLAKDACNWSGQPMLDGNVRTDAALRGNITQLKIAGLIETIRDRNETWVDFTDQGVALAETIGISI